MAVPFVTVRDGGGDYPILIMPHEIVWNRKNTDFVNAADPSHDAPSFFCVTVRWPLAACEYLDLVHRFMNLLAAIVTHID